MSVPVKLAGFAVVLALVFGAAAALGSAVGPEPSADGAGDAGHDAMAAMEAGGHGAAEHGAAQPVRGLAVSEDGLTLELARATLPRGEERELRFRVAGADGETVREFDVEHTKRMHLLVVRRDLSGFQHLHPSQAADGSWRVPLGLPAAGTYRVFADFSHDGVPRTLADDLQVDGTVRSRPLPAPVPAVTVDGLRVSLYSGHAHAGAESELSFAVTRAGRPVALADYLGAKGHLVALREGDLAFLHVHPDADRLRFMATFPSAGRYRLFLQFRAEGELHTAAFTREVER